MLKIENIDTYGWEAAVRGMRNPMNSWDKTDSCFCPTEPACEGSCKVNLGYNDLALMMRLAKAGSDHGKFRRMITVTMDITAPLYWWKEYDTYKVGTVANSCSTMHKIHAKEFTLDDFSCEKMTHRSFSVLTRLIEVLNFEREDYLETSNKVHWYSMIQLLPTSYNQRRTVQLNYEVLANMYRSRRHHKLDEWHTFCDAIEKLPYSDIITGGT